MIPEVALPEDLPPARRLPVTAAALQRAVGRSVPSRLGATEVFNVIS
jgi:hypothetical protein